VQASRVDRDGRAEAFTVRCDPSDVNTIAAEVRACYMREWKPTRRERTRALEQPPSELANDSAAATLVGRLRRVLRILAKAVGRLRSRSSIPPRGDRLRTRARRYDQAFAKSVRIAARHGRVTAVRHPRITFSAARSRMPDGAAPISRPREAHVRIRGRRAPVQRRARSPGSGSSRDDPDPEPALVVIPLSAFRAGFECLLGGRA
jgi:hypothetical protein